MIDEKLLVPQDIPPADHPDVLNPTYLTIGTLYRFQKPGIILPKHKHTVRNNHTTIVLSGRLLLTEGETKREISVGDIVYLEPEVPHEFVSLEPNSAILNLMRLNATADSVREEFIQISEQAQIIQKALEAAQKGLSDFMSVVNG